MLKIVRFCLSFFFLHLSYCLLGQVAPSSLRCMDREDPLGVCEQHPRFSWSLPGAAMVQTAYELRVREGQGQAFIWQTGKVNSGASIAIPYQGPTLESGKKYYFQVRVWDGQGHPSPWSRMASWQMGLLHAEDWAAQWISPGFEEDTLRRPP